MPLDPQLASLLAQTAGTNAFEGVTGEGGAREWPKDGTHVVYITDFSARAGKFKNSGTDYNAISIQFSYQNKDVDPTDPRGTPLAWEGSFFNIPVNPAEVPGSNVKEKGVGWRMNNDNNRLMSIAKCVLGPEAALAHKSLNTLVTALSQRMATATTNPVTASVRVDSRKGKGNDADKTYKEEWGVAPLAS